jgi:methylated-DNA-[protein]-cysteine S-methyltransferase
MSVIATLGSPVTTSPPTVLYAVFDTAIGPCGIAWNARDVVAGVQLPSSTAAQLRVRLSRRFRGAVEATPPTTVQKAIDGIRRLLAGQATDLRFIPLDMDGVPDFDRRVYEVARTIPPGSTLSYGEIAARLGTPRDARAVGQALGQNPFAIVVPCHRVVAAGGKLGGFSASGGVKTKLRMLAIEGATHQLGMELTPGDTQ